MIALVEGGDVLYLFRMQDDAARILFYLISPISIRSAFNTFCFSCGLTEITFVNFRLGKIQHSPPFLLIGVGTKLFRPAFGLGWRRLVEHSPFWTCFHWARSHVGVGLKNKSILDVIPLSLQPLWRRLVGHNPFWIASIELAALWDLH